MKQNFTLQITADNNFSILNRIVNVLNRRRVRIKKLIAHENEEDFMKGIPAVSNLKLRASYGITGNQEIGNYSHLGTLGVGGGTNLGRNYLNRIGAVVNNIPNDDFSWEQTSQFNAELEQRVQERTAALVTASARIQRSAFRVLRKSLLRLPFFGCRLAARREPEPLAAGPAGRRGP